MISFAELFSFSVDENAKVYQCDKDNGATYGVSTHTSYSFRGKPTIESDNDGEYNDFVESQLNEVRMKTFPKIVFLGTGSQCPGANRNCTSILIHIK